MNPNNHYYKILHELSEVFGFKVPLDGLMMCITKRPEIDIIKLNDLMIEKHGYDIEVHGSLSDFIINRFGADAKEKINELLKHC